MFTPEPYTLGPKPSLESIGMVIRFGGVGKQDLDFRVYDDVEAWKVAND